MRMRATSGAPTLPAEIEIVNLRTTAIGLTDHPVFPPVREAARRLDDAADRDSAR